MKAAKPSKITRISQLLPDEKNANLGTERGNAFIERSLREYGAGRSILIDKKGRIIAGNKTIENAAAVGIEEVQVIQTDGRRIIAVQRMDLDLAKDADVQAGGHSGRSSSCPARRGMADGDLESHAFSQPHKIIGGKLDPRSALLL